VNKRAIFLDRDGVINRAFVRAGRPYPPTSLAELEVLPGVEDALHALKAAGYQLIVITNQPDVGRGTTTQESVDCIHAHLADSLPLDAIFMCPHDDGDSCACRKPLPGLITLAVDKLDLQPSASYVIGDRWRDMEAGRRAGCRTFFVDYGYDEQQPEDYDFRVNSLLDAAKIILEHA
jgi:D-glycero-D-manno-heptose 1,7-bisphosphate phosphatase